MFGTIYILILLSYMCMSELLMILVSLELLSWVFSFLLSKEAVFKYLLIQSFFLLVSIMVLLSLPELFLLALSMKMGLPPFSIWLLSLIQGLEKKSFVWMMTVHKLAPMLTLLQVMNGQVLFLSVVLVSLSGGATLLFSHFTMVLMFSSFIHSGWMLLAYYSGTSLFWVYWSQYSVGLMILVLFLTTLEMKLFSVPQGTLFISTMLIVSGLPPFMIFWLKLYVLQNTVVNSLMACWILLMISVAVMSAYYRAIHLSACSSPYKSSGWYALSLTSLSILGIF
uniref:NADH-ubiquinone oxidoreductase chain 2 n=1 Tax=Paralongidorus litoralis TaxID=474435 RepID=A0A1P8C772_9BILA|nr:NADH dehydrogenase subunit 2 [Paralongidorus litoralis]AOT84250.1 NADH dehydrogenase subunit 2 [Paralongidorus litoralis]